MYRTLFYVNTYGSYKLLKTDRFFWPTLYKHNKHKHIFIKVSLKHSNVQTKHKYVQTRRLELPKNRHKIHRFVIIVISDVVKTWITKTKTKV